MLTRIFKVLAIALALPALCFFINDRILAELATITAGDGGPAPPAICADLGRFAGFEVACQVRGTFQLLRGLCLLALALPVALVAIQLLAARRAGRRRDAMARIFPPLTWLTLAVLLLLAALQGWIGTATAWMAFQHQGRDQADALFIAALVFAGAAAAIIVLTQAMLAMSRGPASDAIGQRLDVVTAPALFAHLHALAARLDATPPQHVVVGLWPGFYVSSAPVRLPGETRGPAGETLYLSLPETRLLTRPELDAVVGHELAHFAGEDTRYGLRFAPVYLGLGQALEAMTNSKGRHRFLVSPVSQPLGLLHELFAHPAAALSREREFAADQAGAAVTSTEASALSLLKSSVHDDELCRLLQAPAFVHSEPARANISQALARSVQAGFSREGWEKRLQAVLSERTPHPTDSHPPTGERLTALGFPVAGLDVARLGAPPLDQSGASLIDNLDAVEQAVAAADRQARAKRGEQVPEPLKPRRGTSVPTTAAP